MFFLLIPPSITWNFTKDFPNYLFFLQADLSFEITDTVVTDVVIHSDG